MLASSPASTRPRTLPPGFILPCLATALEEAPRGPRWVHEIKHDGYRLCACKRGDDAALWIRPGSEVGDRYTRITAMMRTLPATSCTIDGEVIVRRPGGLDDFHALRSPEGAAEAILVAFDLLELHGVDLRRQPLEERRTRLAALIDRHARRRGEPDPALLFSVAFEADGAAVFASACKLGCEGIVSKRVGSIYLSDNSKGDWVQTLNPSYVRSVASDHSDLPTA